MRASFRDFEWFRVRWKARYGWYVERGPAVIVVAEAADDRIWLARIRRPVAGRAGWECAGGEVARGETPKQAALRELEEECGLVARSAMVLRFTLEPAPGMLTFPHHVVVARGVRPAGARARPQASEGIERVRQFGRADLVRRLGRGDVVAMPTIAALASTGWLG